MGASAEFLSHCAVEHVGLNWMVGEGYSLILPPMFHPPSFLFLPLLVWQEVAGTDSFDLSHSFCESRVGVGGLFWVSRLGGFSGHGDFAMGT